MSFRTAYGYSVSENGWRMCNRDECDLVRITDLYLTDTAPLRKGPPLVILGAWLWWYDRNVEEITSSVWGWSATNDVANSNHLSGTAVDINAPKYPWGTRTMPPDRIAKIRRGLQLFEGTVFWGADWNRADEMHFQCSLPEGDPRNEAFADKLLAGYLGIYKPGPTSPSAVSRTDHYALDIIAEGQRRGITPRGITIALATALVESNIQVYANPRVPESMNLPHDNVASDAYSVGIFQQQVRDTGNGWWWGDARTCMDPTLSAGLFYDRLARLDYNNQSRSPGSYAQDVQSSAYPDRYDQRYAEAEQLYARLATAQPLDPWEEFLMSDELLESVSIYATPGEGAKYTPRQMLQSVDGMTHRELVENAARLGDPDALARIAAVAAGRGKYRDQSSIDHAVAVLAEIDGKTTDQIKALIKEAQQ